MKVRLRRFAVVCRRRTMSSSSSSEKKPFVIALRKVEGQGMAVEDREASANIDILSIMHKSNQRFTLSHSRDAAGSSGGKPGEGDEDPDKLFAPQHRRYLTFPKVKQSGSFSQREKLDNQSRLDRAVSNSHKYQLESLGLVDQSAAHNSLTNYKGMASVIEDKIQLSILQGDFDNLKGSGKPVDNWTNPFIDRTEDLCHEILKKNGIKPEWIESQQSMTQLNNHLRALVRALMFNRLAERRDAGFADVAALLPSLSNVESLCWSYTDLYNLQVPHFSLTRGRVSMDLVLREAWAQWEADNTRDPAEALAEARDQVELGRHLFSRLHVEHADRRGSRSGPPPPSSQGLGHTPSTSHHHHFQQQRHHSAKQILGAGTLTMNFFMAPVDRLISVINRLL